MYNVQCFDGLVYGMAGLAVVVFVSLYFVTAGYGQFRTRQWGWSINNKVAWMLMELPVFLVMLAIWHASSLKWHLPQLVLFCLFELHYFQRSLVFPFLLKGKSRMPVAIMLMGILFNVINGVIQGGGLYWFPNPDFDEGVAYLLRPNAIAGILLFLIGMAINLHSDHIIRHLRKPGDTRHYLPQKGMYRYVTSANYLGEIMEWTGFAIAAATPAAWVFPLWTAANLVPRAHAIYNRYKKEFGKEALAEKKRIIPFIY
jgi:3-oxo-5-alpha-steroid 4-dehydrogenase 1